MLFSLKHFFYFSSWVSTKKLYLFNIRY